MASDSKYIALVKTLLEDRYGSEIPFNVLLETVLCEGKAAIDIEDYEKGGRWETDEQGNQVGSRDVTITATDFENISSPGSSLLRRGYVFLPMPFSLNKAEGRHILRHISGRIFATEPPSEVTVSVYPGYGVTGYGAYPALHLSEKGLPPGHEHRGQVEDQLGQGGVVYAVDGNMISDLLREPPPPTAQQARRDPLELFTTGPGEKDEPGDVAFEDLPPWLQRLHKMLDGAIESGQVEAKVSSTSGFGWDLVLWTKEGDSVLVISKQKGRGAYIFKKKMALERRGGAQAEALADWDVVVGRIIKRFRRENKGKPREEKTQPRLGLRRWLQQTEANWGIQQGFMLRRDFHEQNLADIIKGGINYENASALREAGGRRREAPAPEAPAPEAPAPEAPETPEAPTAPTPESPPA
jgi:hypothetical protein